MVAEARLAERLGLADAPTTRRQEALLRALGLPVRAAAVDAEAVLAAITHDKKARDGRVPFVLAPSIGAFRVVYDVAPPTCARRSPPSSGAGHDGRADTDRCRRIAPGAGARRRHPPLRGAAGEGSGVARLRAPRGSLPQGRARGRRGGGLPRRAHRHPHYARPASSWPRRS